MKKTALYFILSITIFVSSCKKEVIYPSDELTAQAQVPNLNNGGCINRWGKFVIVGATMWVENHETGEKKTYNHFSANKSRSSLRWGGSLFDIENIIKDTTTYSFYKPFSYPGFGRFVLNDDTTKFYVVNYVGMYSTIMDDPTHGQSNIGGSSRPFSGITVDYNNNLIGITIQEVEGSIDGYNCRYFTELTLRKIESF